MCGISCCYKCKAPGNKRLLNRGPDYQSTTTLDDDITLIANILHVQGTCKQPCSMDGYHLIYNGQLFRYPQVCYCVFVNHIKIIGYLFDIRIQHCSYFLTKSLWWNILETGTFCELFVLYFCIIWHAGKIMEFNQIDIVNYDDFNWS